MYVNIYANVTDYAAEPSAPAQSQKEECSVCGEGHVTAACPLLGLAQKVDDKSVPSRARLSLPPTLALAENAECGPRVTAREDIPVGTQFGPVEAPRYRAFKGRPRFKLKVFPTKGRATCLDTSDEYQCNWMCFVEPASEPSVQNLIAYQLGQDIYFSVQKPIKSGDALYVGYAPPYGRKMAGPTEELPSQYTASVPAQPGGPPAKRKRGRPPRSASMARPTKVTIIPQVDPGQAVLTGDSPADGTVSLEAASSVVSSHDRQQWTCSQCGRLYRDSVQFARHLQDHYRPAYLRELMGRQREGGRPHAIRGRGRPRSQPLALQTGQVVVMTSSGDTSNAVPLEAITEEASGALLIQGDAVGQMTNQNGAVIDDKEAQEKDTLEEGNRTQLLIQLQDGSIHEILAYDGNLNLPATAAIVEGQQPGEGIQLVEDSSCAAAPATTMTLTTLDQLSLRQFPQEAVVAVPNGEPAIQRQRQQQPAIVVRRGRKPKASGATTRESGAMAARRFEEVERQSAGKYNLRTTRKALVVDEGNDEDSDYEGDDYSDYESGYDGKYASGFESDSQLPSGQVSGNELIGPRIATTAEGEPTAPNSQALASDVPKELHVAVEMLTSLPCQSNDQPMDISDGSSGPVQSSEDTQQKQQARAKGLFQFCFFSFDLIHQKQFIPVSLRHFGGPLNQELSAAVAESLGTASEAMATEPVDAYATESTEVQEEGGQVVEKFYRSVEQVRLDRPKRPGRFSCDLCGKGFNQTLYLFRHIRKHTGEFTCHRCNRVFARKENLQNHACSGRSMDRSELPCTVCGKTFGTDRLLRRHMAKHTGQHMCPDCGKSYTTREILSNHACPQRPKVERFSCGVCGKAFTRHGYLLKHLPVHTGQHACPVCGKWLRSLDSLANHMRLCTQVQEIQLHGQAACSHCQKVFTNAAEFRRHQYEHTHVHQCEVCGGRFRNPTLLAAHVCQGKPVECEACGEVFQSVAARDQHQAATHGEPQFKCETCGKGFFKQETLSEHPCVNILDATSTESGSRKRDTNLTPLVCEICGSTFSSTSSLNVHKTLHGEKRFQCDVCGKRFHRKDLLLEHHAVHGDPTYPCPTCQKLFKTKKSLDVHMMIHSGVKRFKCGVCGKEFFQKGNLQKHEDTHLSERRHRCTVCQKVFTTRESLARHMLEHSRGKIFTCGVCGRAFVKEHQLRSHHRMFHSNQVYTCCYCGLSLKLRHSLKRHLRKKHPEEEAQWSNPDALSAMLVSKALGNTGLESDMGLDADATVESLQHAAETATNPTVTNFEVAFEGTNITAAMSGVGTNIVQDTTESLVANVMGEHGSSEVLLAVEGLSSEELREAIASGRAQIKQGPTPDTIEISMPFDVTDEAGRQVTYMANLVDPTDQVVVKDETSVIMENVLEEESVLNQAASSQYVVSTGVSELTETVVATGTVAEDHAAIQSLQDDSSSQMQNMVVQEAADTSSEPCYVTLPTYETEAAAPDDQQTALEAADGGVAVATAGVTAPSDLPADLSYEEPQFVVTEQEVADGDHVVYETGQLQEQAAIPQGTIVLDDGTILQQEEQQGGSTDLLLYVLTTSDTQDD
nr:uncharacterized protein LOC126536779 [Dermacentor andersoni]